MAISVVQTTIAAQTAAGTTAVKSFASLPSLSNKLIAYVTAYNASAAVTFTVTDNQGNTWTNRASKQTANAGVPIQAQIWDCSPTTSAGTFTVTLAASAGSSDLNLAIQEVSGLGAFDQTANYDSNTTTNTSGSATTPTLTNASEFVSVASAWSTASGTTPTAGYTNIDTAPVAAGLNFSFDYKIVSSTTAVSASETWAGGAPNVILIGTWQASGAAPAAPILRARRKIITGRTRWL